MVKWLLRIGLILLAIFFIFGIWAYRNVRDRHPGYAVNLKIDPPPTPGILKVGFAALPITPKLVDTWTDANGDARFREKDGDAYQDRNGNGTFDAFWMAGFHQRRPAAGVHDDLWARAMVIDDGQTRLAVLVLDAIGFMHDDVVDVRNLIPEKAGIDYAIVCSTHDHEAPDLIGIWGSGPFTRGVNPAYLRYVKDQAAKAIARAAFKLRPAKLRFVQDLKSASKWVGDSRKPIVLDPGLRLIHAVDAQTDTTLGVLISWANHPETLGSKNLLITSDYPNFVRQGLEKGIYDGDKLVMPGVGGVAVFVNGAIGGLMTTLSYVSIQDPFADTSYTRDSFAKARAQGTQLAMLALKLLRGPDVKTVDRGGIRLRVKTIQVPLDNKIFRLAAALKVIHRGFVKWMNMRSEVAAWTLGPASFITVPGEIYPEIVNGGIETPDGRDFNLDRPIEVPPLRELMPGEFRFVFGLANDEIGYIIPKSEWDEKPPYLYNAKSSPYGEVNSVGPKTAPIIHDALQNLLAQF